MRYLQFSISLVVFIGILFSQPVSSQDEPKAEHDPEIVFAFQGEQIISQKAIDGAFHRIPEENRLAFIRDGKRINVLINSIMLNKILAAEAKKTGLDHDPYVRERLQLVVEQELAVAWKIQVLNNAPEVDYEAIAYESYLANRNDFISDEVLDVSHILISTKNRPEAEAARLADSISLKLDEEPGRFEELAMEYSEDPGKELNQGRFPNVTRGQMARPFERAAYALTTAGEISAPVKTKFGYHIIQLNARQEPQQLEFDQVKEELTEKAMKDHRLKYRENYMLKLFKDPLQIPDGALEIMVKRHFGENLELAPDYWGQESGRSD